MTEVELADAAARSRASHALDSRLFVEAGAGSGKTSVLVARVLELVRGGTIEIAQVAAITFTEAAAAELRERIHRALEQRASDDPGDARTAEALATLDEAAITTIHGFARRLLAEHPLEAGLPFELEILDEVAEDEELNRRFRALLDAFADLPADRELTAALLALGVSDRQLAGLARAVDARYDALERSRAERGRAPGVGHLGELVAAAVAEVEPLVRRLAALARYCVSEKDALGRNLSELVEYRRPPAMGATDESVEWLVQLPLRPNTPRAGRSNWRGIDPDDVKVAYELASSRREEQVAAVRELVLRALLERLLDEALAAADERRRSGRVTFHDLLVLARRLVATNPRARAHISARYRSILVDEFQDTDPLQLELVEALVDESEDPGSLFLVGDPRQAIYRFRGADLALYERARAAVGESERLELRTNFRSVPGILNFVNASLEQIAPGASGGGGLLAHRAALEERASVVVLGGPLGQLSAAERRRTQGEELASAICAVVEEGWPVALEEGPPGATRPARLGDIAILLPSRTGLQILERALSEKLIPYRIETPQLTYATREVQDLLAVVWALVAPGEERAVLAALRSGVFGSSDEELLAYRRSGGEWRLGLDPGPAATGRVTDSLAVLARLSGERHHLRPAEVLERVIARRRLRQVAAGSPDPVEARRRVEFLLGEAALFGAAGGRTLPEFYRWTRQRAEHGQRAGEARSREADSVQIMTVHGAKGLEFPIVVLSELGGALDRPGRGAQLLFDGDEVGVHLRKGVETANFADLSEAERAKGVAEMLRVGYVGLTRARDHLVVCVHHEAPRAETIRPASLAALLHATVERRPELARRIETTTTGPLVAVRPTGPFLDEQDYLARRAELESLADRASTARSVAASSLGERASAVLAGGGDREESYVLDALALGTRRDASAVGRATHAVLEHLDVATLEDLDELVAAACAAERCSGESARVRELAQRAGTVEVLHEARHAARSWRELPVAAPLGDGILEGIVDLCFVDDEGRLVVVDYKTDAIDAPQALEQRRDHYELQLGAYALALEAATDLVVARLVLVFLGGANGPITVDLDPDGARRRAQGIVESLFRVGTTRV